MKTATRLLALGAIFFPLVGHAQSRSWIGTTGSWDVPSNWSGSAVPTSADDAIINNSGTALLGAGVSGTAKQLLIGDTSGGSLVLSGGRVFAEFSALGNFAGATGSATISSGTWMNSENLAVGHYGTGRLIINGGYVSSLAGHVGFGAGASGSVAITSGTWATSDGLFFGAHGTGSLLVNGGHVLNDSHAALGFLAGSSGTATVTSGTWNNTGDLVVGDEGTGSVIVNGGYVSNLQGHVGYTSGGSGSVTVSSGTWFNSDGLYVGNSGTGTLNLENQGVVSVDSYVYLAKNAGSLGTVNFGTGGTAGSLSTLGIFGGSGTAVVNFNHTGSLTFTQYLAGSLSVSKLGSGTTILTEDNSYTGGTRLDAGVLSVASNLNLGSGLGILVFNGGTLRATSGFAMSRATTLNAAGGTFDVATATLYQAGKIGGTGSLTKLGAGELKLTGSNSYSGNTTVRNGSLAVAEGGSIHHTSGTIIVGNLNGDAGSLAISDGAVASGQAFLGGGSGAFGTATVTAGTWSNTGNIHVGGSGTGVLNIDTDGLVSAQQVWIAAGGTASRGTTTVNGGTMNATGGLIVGYRGTGALNITDGRVTSAVNLAIGNTANSNGTVNLNAGGLLEGTSTAYIGTDAGSLGTVTVNGGTWTNSGNIRVGRSGVGVLTLNSGRITSGGAQIGSDLNSSGTATVNGGLWTSTANLAVGFSGTGHLFLNGGLLSGASVTIGSATNSRGFVTVTGGTLVSTGIFSIGNDGRGTLQVDGGLVTGGSYVIGTNGGGRGIATAKSGTWIQSDLIVGYDGNGGLNVDGGLVSGSNAILGNNSGGSGTATVSSGTWMNARIVTVGLSGTGTLRIEGGLVTSSTTVLASAASARGEVTLAGGILQTRQISGGAGTASLVFDGGTLRATGAQNNFLSGFEAGDIMINSGGATFDSNGVAVTSTVAMGGTGPLAKIGAGTLTLSGSNAYSGPTTVSAGKLAVNGFNSGTGAVTVRNGGTLAGSGTIAGGVTLQNGSTLATGNSIGTLTVGSASFESGSLFSLEGDGTFFDSLVVSGNVAITSGALISFDLLSPLTAVSYTLITAAGGLDGSTQFALSGSAPFGYVLQYSGTTLSLVQAPAEIGTITATPEETTIITGGTTAVVVTVGNDTQSGGVDLDATVTGDVTNVSGTGTVVVAPQSTGTAAPDLAFTGTTIGVQTGTVTVTDPNATNSPQTGTVTVTVLDHADPILTVSGGNSQSVIVGATGITATLNLANGSSGETNLSPMDVGNLSGALSGPIGSGVIGSGTSANYTAGLNTGTVGASQNQVFSLDAGDEQTLPGANALGTYSATVALNVYGHAAPSVSGTTLSLGYVHEGYALPVVSTTQLVTNGTAGAYIVDLKASATTSGNITLNGVSGVASGSSANIAATLATGQGVGVISGTLGYTFADDSSLAGASGNVGTTTFVVTGEVYSGQGVWITSGSGSWGTLASGFGVNWQAGGGSPGLDAAFASTDTATFGTAGSGVVTLDGAAPSLKAITFDNTTDSYAILQGSGGTLTLNGGTNAAVIENLNGNHFIGTPINLATNTLFTVANAADRLTLSGAISGSGNVEIGGSGRTVFTQNHSYIGTTTVTSGVLASRNLTGGTVNLEGGLFSPGDEGTMSLIITSALNLNGGGLEFDLGSSNSSDVIVVTGTATLNAATQFTFLDAGFAEGVFALVQSSTLANFGDLSNVTFTSDIDGLQGLFGVANNTLYFRGFMEDTIFTGPVLSNYAPYLIPTTGQFLVDGPVTTWPEDLSNTIDSLIFKNTSSLFVFNDLTVTSGNFTVRRGSATMEGGRVVVPGDFNLIGRGTLYAGSEFAIGGDANINGGNLVIDGLFNAGGAMNVHSTVTVNGNAQIGGNLNTDASEIIVNGIFGIGKSANIANGSFLLVNQGGMMNVAQATNIHAGSGAQINGLLTSPQVNVSGLLGGTGVIAGNLWNNGIVAPGNSPGTLTVNGNYVQTEHGALQIEFGDLLFVSGHASLAGRLQLLGGRNLKYGQQITFLQAGSISGEFDEIVVPNPSKNRGRVLTEGGAGTLLIAPTSYTLVAETTNQLNVAKALDSYIAAKADDRETVSVALDLQSEDQYPAAFDQIAPTYYEALGTITIEQAFVQSQQLNQRLSAVRLGARGFQAIGIESPLKHDKDGKSVLEARDAKKTVEAETATNWNIWAMGNGLFAKVTGIGQLPNYSFNSGGFLVGGDYTFGRDRSPNGPSTAGWDNQPYLTLGLYGGYQYTWADAGNNGNTQINSALFGGYASYTNGGFYADGIVGGGYNGYRVRRGITFSTIERTARSQPNGGQMNASLNLGYDWEIGKFTLGPIAGVQYAYAGIAPFTETGADSLDLRVAQQNVNTLRTTFGGRVAYTWNVTDRIAIIPEVRMFWQHEFLNNPRNISSALDGGSGPAFGYETIAPARDSVFAGAGLSAQFGERWNAFLYWNVDFGRQNFFGNSVSGGLNWKF